MSGLLRFRGDFKNLTLCAIVLSMSEIPDELPFGIVQITDGEFKGEVGYYDDDDIDYELYEETGLEIWCGVVYFGAPFKSDYHLIPLDYLKPTDMTHLPTERFCRKHPELAYIAGVPELKKPPE